MPRFAATRADGGSFRLFRSTLKHGHRAINASPASAACRRRRLFRSANPRPIRPDHRFRARITPMTAAITVTKITNVAVGLSASPRLASEAVCSQLRLKGL
jgi:hypothetical protein